MNNFSPDFTFWAAVIVFAVTYGLIITELVDSTAASIFGAVLMLALGVLGQDEAFHVRELGVDWNVIFLLVSMMALIAMMKPSGIFEYVAIKSAKLGRGDPAKILYILAILTALASSLLDNITTVLLLIPVTMFIADALDADPIPFLLTEVFASNIGGTATLIGDPPNIMIASRAGLSFMDFLYNLGPAVIVIMAGFLLMIKVIFGRGLHASEDVRARIMAMDHRGAIKDKALAIKSVLVLALVLLGFIFQGKLGYEPATVALFGAGLLLLLTGKRDMHKLLSGIEWPTIFFFIGLFIIVGGAVKVGFIKWLSSELLRATGANMFRASMLVMWLSAGISAFINNIPFVAAMNPLVEDMARQLQPGQALHEAVKSPMIMPVWWSLALGACLGGNGTAIGASANVIVFDLSKRHRKKISFLRFMLYGMPVTFMSVGIAALYVWIRYFVF
ncbi:MAG: ArsB/NhaD family transporter [Nitrospirota bacterium]